MASSTVDEDGSGERIDSDTLFSLMHECDLKESLLRSTRNEIDVLRTEVEKLRLEKEWCVDKEGKRIIPTAHHQAMEICQQIMLDPDLLTEVVKALRIKKIDLQSNINELTEKCNALNGKTK